MSTRRYAEGTDVPVERSRGEITGILAAHGVVRMGWASEPAGDQLQFELAGHVFRFSIRRPNLDDIQAAWRTEHPSRLARPPDWAATVTQEWRRRWRANVLLLKAKLEFADDERSTVLRELLPYAVLTDGRTLEEAIVAGDSKLPLLAARSGS